MCGLIGGTLYDAETAAEALELISHRGRDARGLKCYEYKVWLGHNRLSIQDLSAGADQPFERGGISVVFNGELWRRSMGGSGYTSDTKLLADLYLECGADPWDWARCMDGMFAAAVYDRARRRVVLARDWLGRMPLYCVRDARGLAFASEAKALCVPLGRRFGGSAPRAQAASEVKLFPAGCVATYGLDDGAWECQPFRGWDDYPTEGDGDDLGINYYVAELRRRLEAAVANEGIADVPVCTILSGGVDSTLVTAILAKLRPGVRAYTVSVGGSDGKDDLLYARYAAAEIGVELVEVILTQAEVDAAMREAVWAVEDARWVQVAPAVPQIALARRIGADGYKVVFGGEGADELFGSYGDVRRWSWRPEQYRKRRLDLCRRLHDNNLIRGNKAMMWGGTVELRTPFLDREVVDLCLRIPSRYRADRDGAGRHVKYVLRRAFEGTVPDALLWRPKVAFQDGAHSDFLRGRRGEMESMLGEMFGGRRGGVRPAGLRV